MPNWQLSAVGGGKAAVKKAAVGVGAPTAPYRRFTAALPPLLHHDHFLCEPSAVHDQLIDVDTGCRFTVGLQNLAIPVCREWAVLRSRGASRQLEIVEILAGALKNRHGDELRQHVVDLERYPGPMTIGKQIAVQGERDRGRRIERVRVVLLQLHQRRRGRLPEHAVYPCEQAPSEPPDQYCPTKQPHPRLLCERKRCVRPLSLLVQGARVNAATQNLGTDLLPCQARKTLVSPLRLVIPRRSAHSSSGIKYLRVKPSRSRNCAGVAAPSSRSVSSTARRNSSSACFCA